MILERYMDWKTHVLSEHTIEIVRTRYAQDMIDYHVSDWGSRWEYAAAPYVAGLIKTYISQGNPEGLK
jgi:hypothetical protein